MPAGVSKLLTTSVPPELKATPWPPGQTGHYELVPAHEGFTYAEVVQLLNSITTRLMIE